MIPLTITNQDQLITSSYRPSTERRSSGVGGTGNLKRSDPGQRGQETRRAPVKRAGGRKMRLKNKLRGNGEIKPDSAFIASK